MRSGGVGTGVLRTWAPIAIAASAFLAMAAAVEPAPPEEVASASGPAGAPVQQLPAQPSAGPADGAATPGTAGAATAAAGPATSVAPAVGACTARQLQVPGDPYSPPCLEFSGDNGGATARGVTADEIVVSVRLLEGPTASEIFADISGERVNDSPEAYRDTVLALAEYFSNRFQFYGRRLRIEFFQGQGSGTTELLGGGQDRALADALRASEEIGAFADITGLTIPYAESLTRQGVVNIGAPYPPRSWFVERRPYAWSTFIDSTRAVEAASLWLVNRIANQPAQYAGPAYNGQPRRFALVGPENDIYQSAANTFFAELARYGVEVELNLKYRLDINSMPNQAANIIAQLKDAGITTVLCGCDPVMLALGLTPKANEQGYEPEWVTAGLAFVDQDLVSQLIQADQWSRAFGIAFNAESEPLGRSFPYAAYRQMRPNDEPAFGVEEIYYQLYMLAIGIHMAGPNLTPQTFEAGMFAYPGGFGPRGSWGFGEGDYTPMDDFREIWWDPDRLSPQNGEPGTWIALNGGARYTTANVPSGPAPYFEEGP